MKPEWAYLNFLDRYQKKQPHALKSEGILAWKKYREEQVKIIENILEFKINKIAQSETMIYYIIHKKHLHSNYKL